jgi:hypothetical protein
LASSCTKGMGGIAGIDARRTMEVCCVHSSSGQGDRVNPAMIGPVREWSTSPDYDVGTDA